MLIKTFALEIAEGQMYWACDRLLLVVSTHALDLPVGVGWCDG
jgi:hypothetical protein